MLAMCSVKDIVHILNTIKKTWVLHKGTGERRKNAASTSFSIGATVCFTLISAVQGER